MLPTSLLVPKSMEVGDRDTGKMDWPWKWNYLCRRLASEPDRHGSIFCAGLLWLKHHPERCTKPRPPETRHNCRFPEKSESVKVMLEIGIVLAEVFISVTFCE